MHHNQGRHLNLSASSWGNTPICVFAGQVFADPALGLMQRWAPEVQKCGSCLYTQSTNSLPRAVRPADKQRPQYRLINECTDGGVEKCYRSSGDWLSWLYSLKEMKMDSG